MARPAPAIAVDLPAALAASYFGAEALSQALDLRTVDQFLGPQIKSAVANHRKRLVTGTVAEVLSSMIHQAPDSELVRNLAAAFAPKDGVEVAEALDSLLGGRVTHWISTKPMSKLRSKTLMEIRERARTEPSIANEALIHGTVTLLLSAGVLEDAERTELTDALVPRRCSGDP